MSDTIESLRAEVQRLRDLLEEEGINPEPYVEPPPQFGPPTLQQYHMNQAMTRFVLNTLGRQNPIWSSEAIGPSLRIRINDAYAVKPDG